MYHLVWSIKWEFWAWPHCYVVVWGQSEIDRKHFENLSILLVQFFFSLCIQNILFFSSIKSSPSFIQNLPQTHSPWLSRARPPNLRNEIENALLFLLDSKKTLNLCWLIFLSLHLKITNGKVCFSTCSVWL